MATLLPPKELHVEVRVIQDCGVIQTEQVRTQNIFIFIFIYSVCFISFFILFHFIFSLRKGLDPSPAQQSALCPTHRCRAPRQAGALDPPGLIKKKVGYNKNLRKSKS